MEIQEAALTESEEAHEGEPGEPEGRPLRAEEAALGLVIGGPAGQGRCILALHHAALHVSPLCLRLCLEDPDVSLQSVSLSWALTPWIC